MERIMGLDFGSKTVGVAVSDPLFITAQGIEIIRRERTDKLRKTYARIEELIQEYEVTKTVDRCPLCGIRLNEEGVCPKCGYRA